MGSPVTFSGFNNIDFSVILSAVMQQESRPLNALTAHQTDLTTRNAQYKVLGTKLSALDAAATALRDAATVTAYSATTSDPSAVGVTASSGAVAGRYDVVVSSLARAQVTASASTAPDADTTVVASSGSITIGGTQVDVLGDVTLQGLAATINSTVGIGVSASVIQSAPGAFQLVLTAKDTGFTNKFTITNALAGGLGVAFTDGNHDGTTGDELADNVVQATDASLTVNNIHIASSSNTLTSVISGVTLQLNQEDPLDTVVVQVAADNASLVTRVNAFATAYNDIVTFTNGQTTADKAGNQGGLARDPVLMGIRNQLRIAINGTYGTGTFTHLAEVGVGFDRMGLITIDATVLNTALSSNAADVTSLFTGAAADGAFAGIHNVLAEYTGTGGLISLADQQLTSQLSRLQDQIDRTTARLAQRRVQLQRQFTAADQAMTALNAQSGALAKLGINNSN